jgi:hypothetical protein
MGDATPGEIGVAEKPAPRDVAARVTLGAIGPGEMGSEEVAGVKVIVGVRGRAAPGAARCVRVALGWAGISMKNEAGRTSVVVVGEWAGESEGVGTRESESAAGEWDEGLSIDSTSVVGDAPEADKTPWC